MPADNQSAPNPPGTAPAEALEIRLGRHTLGLERARVMGILNVTPDSFSDGGRFLNVEAALQQASRMATQGADIIDVGGESTRPGAAVLPLQQELDRVLPVIEAIVSRFDVAVSVDTSKAAVMRSAVDAGAALINDVFALRRDGALQAAAALDAAVCLMHMQGEPGSMQKQPHYDRLPGEVIDFLAARVAAAREAGIAAARIIVDPGFGFGKNDRHNLEILANLEQFRELRRPMLVGLSRKRMLGNLTGRAADERVAAGVAAAVIAVTKGAKIIRTHDVGPTVDALKVCEAVRQIG
jgi:dihydropteroate synthase